MWNPNRRPFGIFCALFLFRSLPLVLDEAAAAAPAGDAGDDELSIIRTVNAVAITADRKDWPACRGLFADEVDLDYSSLTGIPPARIKADDLIAAWAKALGPVKATQHSVTNHQVTIEGDHARCFSYVTAQHFHPVSPADGADFWTVVGTYEHQLVKAHGGGWQVVAMRFVLKRQEGNQDLLRLASGAGRQDAVTAFARDGRAVVHEFLDALEAKDIERFLRIWDERGVQVMPYAPEGFPLRLEGKDAIRRQYGGLPENFESMRFVDRRIYTTDDPDVIWATYRGEIQVKATRRPYNNTYVGRYVIQKGRIMEYDEYFNPLVLLSAFGDAASLQKNFNINSQGP